MLDYIVLILDNKYTSGALLSAFGLLLGIVSSRITSKLAGVIFAVSTSKLGQTTNNDIHGKLEVYHRGEVLPNFYFSNVLIKNTSNVDLENIQLTFYVSDGVLILSDFIRYEKAVRDIPYSEHYQIITKNPADPLFFVRREYLIPVLNRGQTIILELTLTHKLEISFPRVHASMVHKGARLFERPFTAEVLGIPVSRTLPWAIILGILSYILTSFFITNCWISGIFLLCYGLFAQHVAALILKSYDFIGEKTGILPPSK